MNNWLNILKDPRQISDTKTNLNIISEPLGDELDCCQQAKNKYKVLWSGSTKKYDDEWSISSTGGFAGTTDCKWFRDMLKQLVSDKYTSNDFVREIGEILDEWEKCEHEERGDEHRKIRDELV